MRGIEDVIWDAQGCAPVVVQDASTGAILALDVLDRATLTATLATGQATYRQPPGAVRPSCASAGPLQMVTALHLACDGRSLLLQVQTSGPLCATSGGSCFSEPLGLAPAGRGRAIRRAASDIAWSPEAAEGAG